MKKIIERLEQASGPDRELDADIALSCGIVRERDGNSFYGHKNHSVMVLEGDYYDNGGNAPELPYYTSSLDAAMTLVPEEESSNFEVSLEQHKRRKRTYWTATIGHMYLDAWHAQHQQAALALCIAALRSREGMQG